MHSRLQTQVHLKKKQNTFSKLIITDNSISSTRGKALRHSARLSASLLEMQEFYQPQGFYPICFINDLSEVNKRKVSDILIF